MSLDDEQSDLTKHFLKEHLPEEDTWLGVAWNPVLRIVTMVM